MRHWQDINKLADKLADKILDSDAAGADEWVARIREQERFDAQRACRRFAAYRRRKAWRWLGVAATVAVLAGVSLLWTGKEEGQMPLPVAQVIEPGAKKAVLTLADGTVRHLQDSSLVVDGRSGTQEKTLESGEEVKAPAYNTLSVPRGGEFFLTLPDSTRVWLNAESELRFPDRFVGDKRVVFLSGEAYFDVERDEEHPFRVELDGGSVNVLGTEFNVSAYAGEDVAATLVEGSVSFRTQEGGETLLRPSQHLVYDAKRGEVSVTEVDTWLYTSWKEEVFCFESQTLENIMTILARWYNVEVLFEAEDLKRRKLSGTLDRYADVQPFLRLFEAGTDLQFTIEQKKIIIRKKE